MNTLSKIKSQVLASKIFTPKTLPQSFGNPSGMINALKDLIVPFEHQFTPTDTEVVTKNWFYPLKDQLPTAAIAELLKDFLTTNSVNFANCIIEYYDGFEYASTNFRISRPVADASITTNDLIVCLSDDKTATATLEIATDKLGHSAILENELFNLADRPTKLARLVDLTKTNKTTLGNGDAFMFDACHSVFKTYTNSKSPLVLVIFNKIQNSKLKPNTIIKTGTGL